MVREQLRTTTTAAVRSWAYDVVAHQQAAMPELLLAPEPTESEHDDQEPEAGRGEAIDMKALRALRESRTDVEALDLTADRLRRLQDAFVRAGGESRVRAARYTGQNADTTAARPYAPSTPAPTPRAEGVTPAAERGRVPPAPGAPPRPAPRPGRADSPWPGRSR
ncbi:hypothetical protein ABT013_34135 [Streptomyces bacillaris]|uniref:hypothetical protein n=1 Tax=Streptomyces bacillaris TaxID=68179 RepID=UPI003361C3D9